MLEVAAIPETNSSTERRAEPVRIRAPREDRTTVAIPLLANAIDVARRNAEELAAAKLSFCGKSLPELRRWARQEAHRAAREYTSAWCDLPSEDDIGDLWFVGGHQPALFHTGVWAKNFAVAEFARRTGGCSLNLVVDNDLCGSTAIRVPTGTREQPSVELVPFDLPRTQQPWEEVTIQDRALFESFPERVQQMTSLWSSQPLIREFWGKVLRFSETSPRISDCFTAARNQMEREWGFTNLELPLSRLCELEPFLWFAAHLLSCAPRFQEVHNGALADYRSAYGIRSRNHPVAELRREGAACEVPFWVWQKGEARRRRVFVTRTASELSLSDGRETFLSFAYSSDCDLAAVVQGLRQLPERGVRFRTRALSTTLFARLCLADLFVHGIGGAKYDEMTDRIVNGFYNLPAPAFLTLTATLHLPISPWSVGRGDELRLLGQLRELDYHSEKYLMPNDADAAPLVIEKQRLITEQQRVTAARRAGETMPGASKANGFARYQRLRELDRLLAERTRPQRERILQELAETQRKLAANGVLQDREYSFGLFPAEKLRSYLEELRDF